MMLASLFVVLKKKKIKEFSMNNENGEMFIAVKAQMFKSNFSVNEYKEGAFLYRFVSARVHDIKEGKITNDKFYMTYLFLKMTEKMTPEIQIKLKKFLNERKEND